MKKNGFTLAEVLISIALIGIISAIISPIVAGLAPRKERIMFKKAYYSLESVINLLITDDLLYPSEDKVTFGSPSVTYSRGFNNTRAVTNGTVNKFCYVLSDSLNTIGTATCPDTSSTTTGSFTTSDGIVWNVRIPYADTANAGITPTTDASLATYQFPVSPTQFTTKVVVDVNGTRPPNCSADTSAATYTMTGIVPTATATCAANITPDRYIFGIRYDGKLQVGSAGGVTDATANSYLADPTTNR